MVPSLTIGPFISLTMLTKKTFVPGLTDVFVEILRLHAWLENMDGSIYLIYRMLIFNPRILHGLKKITFHLQYIHYHGSVYSSGNIQT